MPRISSRMGGLRLTFKPYDSEQIKTIIEQRLASCPIFDKSAVSYISKKVASVSSDIRKTLNICRQAIEDFKTDREKLLRKGESVPAKITIKQIIKTFESTYQSPVYNFVSQTTHPLKLLLLSVYQEARYTQLKTAKVARVYERFVNLWTLFGNTASYSDSKYSGYEVGMMIDQFGDIGILARKSNKQTREPEIMLQTNLDDIAFGLKDFEPFYRMVDQTEQTENLANGKKRKAKDIQF